MGFWAYEAMVEEEPSPPTIHGMGVLLTSMKSEIMDEALIQTLRECDHSP